jgi:hypothetical protein
MISTVAMSTRVPVGDSGNSVGTLSIHLEGARCRVGCAFCYLGARAGDADSRSSGFDGPALALLVEHLRALRYDELAVAVSEPAGRAARALPALVEAAAGRGLPVAVTTTLAVASRHAALITPPGVTRVSLSIDPDKGAVAVERVAAVVERLRAAASRPLEVVLLVSLVSPAFTHALTDGGLLAALVDLPSVDAVALNALKPPPPWCDRRFVMATLGRLQPLLARALDRRLHLDCWIAARLLRLGPCPARADLTPTAGGLAFRSCVYQPAIDFVATDALTTRARLRSFEAPARCPFRYDGDDDRDGADGGDVTR